MCLFWCSRDHSAFPSLFEFFCLRCLRKNNTIICSITRRKTKTGTPPRRLFTQTTYGDEEVIQSTNVYGAGNVKSDEYEKALKEEKHHKQKEHLGEMGVVAAGAFALHEKQAE